jgi:hypothetical protein
MGYAGESNGTVVLTPDEAWGQVVDKPPGRKLRGIVDGRDVGHGEADEATSVSSR